MANTFDTKLANSLNRYLFDKVWNEPNYEYRKNIIPALVSSPISVGRVRLRQVSLSLPTETDPYLVYTIPTKCLGGITLQGLNEWTTVQQFQADTSVEFRVHTETGIMLPRGSMYVTSSPETGSMLLAVDRAMFRNILGASFPTKKIIVAVYYDSDAANPVTIDSRIITAETDINALYATAQLADLVFVNGRYTALQSIADISFEGAYIEMVTDTNLTGSFTLDLAMTGDRRNFTSLIDGHLKAIIHIPKSDNPNNAVISHNTCDIYVLPRNVENANRKGVFFHRAIEEYPLSQITHNDFAVPETLINAYAGSLDSDELTLRVHVRTHSKDNFLIPDKNYIYLLYTHDDETILDFFEGEGPADFEFWRADHLEASQYSRMISDVPNLVTPQNIPSYIDALGYFHTIAFISERVYRDIVPVDNYRHYFLPVPLIFSTNKLEAVVSINGIKLPDDEVNIVKVQGSKCFLVIDESATIAPGDEIVVELFENLPHGIMKILPTVTLDSIALRSTTFTLYEVLDATSPVQGIEQTYDKTYIEIEDLTGIANVVSLSGSWTLVFGVGAYGREFIVAYDEGFEKIIEIIDVDLANKQPIVFDLNTRITSISMDPVFELEDHVGKDSATGTLIDPNDPNAENTYPAWKLMDGETDYSNPANRWRAYLSLGGVSAQYTLAPEFQNTVYMLGFRIGALEDPNDAVRATELPINYDIAIDDIVVYSVRNETWYKNPEPIHTHLFTQPVAVDSIIELRILSLQTGTVLAVSPDLWEPIFSAPTMTTDSPLMGNVTPVAYLNGKELVPDVDFHLANIQDPAYEGVPHFSGRQFVLNNVSYLVEPSGNLLEVFITHHAVVGKDVGFLQRSILGNPNTNPMWFDELSTVCVDGFNTENISSRYGSVEVDDAEFRLGAPYLTRTVIPPRGKAKIDEYHADDDTPVIDQLVPYFRAQAPEPPDLVILPYSHRIVSLFLAIVVRDILNNTLPVVYDPDDERLLEQLVDYEYLKQYDVALNPDSPVDLDFVDVQPTYVEVMTPDPVKWAIIERIVAAVHEDNVAHRRPDHE